MPLPLCEDNPGAEALDAVFQQSREHIYTHPEIVKTEAAGFEILGGLLETFVGAVHTLRKRTTKSEAELARARKMLQLLPGDYLPFAPDQDPSTLIPDASPYSLLLGMTEFVAGMTDTFAVDTFRVLRGIDLPNYSP